MTRPSDLPIKKVLIATHHRLDLWIAPEWFADRLRKEFPELETVRMTTYEGIETELADADIVFTFSIRPEQFKQAKRLRWIHSPAAAVHQFLFPEFVNSHVILTNAREVHGPVVAEHVIALIFALAKRIPQSVRFQQKHVWGQETLWREHAAPAEIAGATLGLVGLGSIGRNVAKRASLLGMQVICVRQHPTGEKLDGVQEVLPSSKLNEMLVRADYVVLAVPVTDQTRHMIGHKQLSQMKHDAYVINVGRGPLIDEAALIEALGERKIAGAALDVFDQEPLPADSAFWDLENVLITPHTAGMTTKLWERHYTLFSENLRRFLRGEPLLAMVDKKQGY
ncbi:MAG TPA: D-2-hydroxyacid dehydrogenase [Terriglobales bacterium]|jgi:phosphoglycerate dehydrogenase-like enzyme|nr:D-2-hydroxyacid dehydrogenase [Terriglobales bacterium]